MEVKLTEKQLRFCQEYIIDLNGSAAAIRAGYSGTTSAEIASENLAKPNIQEYVQELLDDRARRTRATADKVISELYHLVSFDAADIFSDNNNLKDIQSISKETRKAIASIEVFEEYSGKGTKNDPREFIGYTKKIKFWDKTKAIELLARHLKLLTDKTEVSGEIKGAETKIFIIREAKKEDGSNLQINSETGRSIRIPD